MSSLRLSRSIRHSPTRLSSSRARIVWNSSASSSGVAIAMTLGMVFSPRRTVVGRAQRDRLRGADDQARDRQAGLEAEFSAHDVRVESDIAEKSPHVLRAVGVASVPTEHPGRGMLLFSRLLDRK